MQYCDQELWSTLLKVSEKIEDVVILTKISLFRMTLNGSIILNNFTIEMHCD